MSVEDAARVMLEHGMPPGGSAEWDPAGSEHFGKHEYFTAREAYYESLMEEKYQVAGVSTPGEYLEKILTPEETKIALENWSWLGYLEPKHLHDLMPQWEEVGLPPILEPSQRFPSLQDYLDQQYPAGVPYSMGGPWDGSEELKLEKLFLRERVLEGIGWALGVDEQRRVEWIRLGGSALAKLFGAGDMSSEEFAATFASAYDVPLESTADVVHPDIAIHTGNFLRTGWAYVNREGGWAVTISEQKILEVEAITPTEEQSFD